MENVLPVNGLEEENTQENADYCQLKTAREIEAARADTEIPDGDYKVYTSRWLMLFVVSALNFSSSVMSVTFAPAADTFVAFYGISSWQLNVLIMIFLFTNMTVGFLATWVLDTYGLKPSLLVSAWFNALGGLLRGISTMEIVPRDHAYTVLLAGQIVSALAEPFVMYTPSKLAAVWFPPDRRATANMIGNIMMPLGEIACFVIIPLLVNDTADVPTVLWIISSLAFFIVIVATFGVRRSRPLTPPSPSAGEESVSFFIGLKKVLRNKNYIILNLTFGAGLGLFTAMTGFITQVLCPRGYSDEFAGLCASLLIGCGLVIAVLVTFYVEKTKQFDDVFKIMFGISVLCGIAYTQVTRLRDQHALVAIATALSGGAALSIYSVGFELAVEVTYPVASATGPGLCLIGGEIQALVYMFIMQYLTQPLPQNERQLETGCYVPEQITSDKDVFDPRDWTYSNLVILNGVSAVAFTCLVLFFKPTYRRLEAERKILDKKQKTGNDISVIYSTHL